MTTPSVNAGAPARGGAFVQIGAALRELVRTRELRILLLCNCVLGMGQSFVTPFLSLFGTQAVKLSLGMFGVFMTLNAVLSITLSTFLSHRSDTTYSRRSLLLVSSFAGALGYVGYAFVRDPWLLFVLGGAILGVASLAFSQLFACARELVERSGLPKREVPLYMNVFRMAFALSWTVGPAIAAFTLKALSFVGLFLGAASLYLALFFLIFFFVHDHTPAAARSRVAAARLRDVLVRRDVLLWFLALTLMLAAHAMSVTNMSLLVLRALGGNESQVGVIFSLAPVFELPLMLYVGLLATRVRTENLIRASMLVAAVYFVGLSLVQTPAQIYPLQALSAAVVSVTSGVAITFFQNKLPHQLGAATNLYANASRIGSTSSYLTFGLVASHFGHRGTALACALLALAALTLTAFAAAYERVDGVGRGL